MFLQNVIGICIKSMKKYIDDCSESLLSYIYCQKSDGSGGLHLYFPNIIIDREIAKSIIEVAYNDVISNSLFNSYRKEFLKKVIDTGVYKDNGLRMLYSYSNGTYYQINMNLSTFKDISEDKYTHLKLTTLKTKETKINFKLLIDIDKKPIEIPKKTLKKIPIKISKEIPNSVTSDNKELAAVTDIPEFETEYVKSAIKNLELAPLLKDALTDAIHHLSWERNNNYSEWLNIGILLFKFGKFGINLWKEFSKQCSAYDEKEIDAKVKTFRNTGGLKFATLLFWVRTDDLEYFAQYEDRYNSIIDRFYFVDNDIGKLLEFYDLGDEGFIKLYHREYKKIMVCTAQKELTFYMFNDSTKLWDMKTSGDIQLHFMENMKCFFEPVVTYYNTLSFRGNADDAKSFTKKAMAIKKDSTLCKASCIRSLLPLIASIFYNDKFIEQLNSKKGFLPVKGGLVDLATGKFIKRTMEDYFSFELDVEWKGIKYETSDIDNFFDDVMLKDKILINYLQKLLGYSISGWVNSQKLVICWGSGGNAKTVLMNMMKHLLSKYYDTISKDVVITAGNKHTAGSASPHLMQLFGLRVAIVDESEEGAKLDEATVKYITGGSKINARPLFGNPITFDPTFQLFLLTNHKPHINVSPSLVRRLLLIPFLAEFKPVNKYDKDNPKHRLRIDGIEEKMYKCEDQFLVWLVNGSMRYISEGLDDIPVQVNDAINKYVDENNDLANYINENCKKEPDGIIYCSTLYEGFKQYTNINMSQKAFSKKMIDLGYEKDKDSVGVYFKGISAI